MFQRYVLHFICIYTVSFLSGAPFCGKMGWQYNKHFKKMLQTYKINNQQATFFSLFHLPQIRIFAFIKSEEISFHNSHLYKYSLILR